MPRLIVPESRIETVVDAITFLLARDGPAGLTVRAVARECRLSPASILHHYTNRERLLHLAAQHTGAARLKAIERQSYQHGVAAFLPAPADDEDLITARAWLAWLELWRTEDVLSTVVEGIRDRESLLLARVVGLPPGGHGLTALQALLDGLTIAVCEPIRPLPPARARQILSRYVSTDPVLGGSEAS